MKKEIETKIFAKIDEKDQMKRYYVDFYDMCDGWGGFGFFTEKLFDDLPDAIKLCDKLNNELEERNKECGEHYGVIDSKVNREVYCGLDEKYKINISDLIKHFSEKNGKIDEIENCFNETDFDVRVDKPPENIEMFAHSADCRYCNGVVKMMRDHETFKLQPNNCSCLMCGQPYFVEIPGSLEEWELKQWRQKGQTFAMGGD